VIRERASTQQTILKRIEIRGLKWSLYENGAGEVPP
jgi:hypothetical protein